MQTSLIPTAVQLACWLTAAASLSLSGAIQAAEPARPNVIVFLADDQGWGDLSLSGNRQLSTPHIDSLARDGASFDRFYVCPVCSPTRAEFLTGRYHLRGGVQGVSTGGERLDLDEKTIAESFRAAGYATAAFGKWHNGSQWPYHPNARGFDEYYGFTSGHWGEYFNPPLDHNGTPVRGEGFAVDDFTQRGMEFMEQHAEQPFFCYFAYNTPHSPFIVPESFWERFENKPITQRGSEGDAETVDVTRAALAMCENIDENVGRVLAKLDALKLRDDTIIVYFSDNGPNSFRWNGGMKGRKGSTDEGGVRSPCIVRWPAKIKPGTTVEPIAAAIDLFPTLASLARVPLTKNQPLDGVDLSPLLVSSGREWPERMIFSHWAGRVSVRTPQYRLDHTGGLYDMLADPGQQHDLREERADVAKRLSAAVTAWRAEMRSEAAEAAKSSGKENGSILPPDQRPFPVGYAAFPRTPLPARDGVPHGNINRSAGAPNCSYFVDWTSTDDKMTWDIEVVTSGEYDVEILYTCAREDVGSEIELSFAESELVGVVDAAWNPPLITDQDVIPRPPGESIMKDFRPLALGTMQLTKGRGPLTLRALKVAGDEVMHVRGVALTLRQP